MDQRAPYRCQQHNQLNGLGPQCYSKCRQGAEPTTIERVQEPKPARAVTVEVEPKEEQKAERLAQALERKADGLAQAQDSRSSSSAP